MAAETAVATTPMRKTGSHFSLVLGVSMGSSWS
jgi:hypothetical protein